MKRLLAVVGITTGLIMAPAGVAFAATLDPSPTASQTAADPQMLDPTADSTTTATDLSGDGTSTPAIGDINPITYTYRITNVAPSSQYRGGKHVCIIFNAHVNNITYNCNIANATTHTVTVTLSASFPVKAATVSVAVGYSVSHTTSVSGGASKTIKRDRAGWLWWAPVMSHRQVTAHKYWCSLGDCHKMTTSATTWTHHFIAPTIGVHFSDGGGGGGCAPTADADGDYEFGTPSDATVYGINSDTPVTATQAPSLVTFAAPDIIPCG